jgi:hypothetical protein
MNPQAVTVGTVIVRKKHLDFGIINFPALRGGNLTAMSSIEDEDRIVTVDTLISCQIIEPLDDGAPCSFRIKEKSDLR